MAAHSTRQPEVLSNMERQAARTRRRLIWLSALLAASAASAVAGIALAEQLTGSSPAVPAVRPEPSASTPEGSVSTGSGAVPNAVTGGAAGTTENRGSPSGAGQAGPQPRQEYVWRRAYVRGTVVLIRVRADAGNVREDRGIGK